MPWLKWLVCVIVSFFLYYGVSQLMGNIVTGTAMTDQFVVSFVPIIPAGVGIVTVLLVFEGK